MIPSPNYQRGSTMLRMLGHTLLTAALAAPAYAQQPAPAMPAVPPHNCVKPELPGIQAQQNRINAFNREFKAYGDCIKKYVSDAKALSDASIAAANSAINEYNQFAIEVNPQNAPK